MEVLSEHIFSEIIRVLSPRYPVAHGDLRLVGQRRHFANELLCGGRLVLRLKVEAFKRIVHIIRYWY